MAGWRLLFFYSVVNFGPWFCHREPRDAWLHCLDEKRKSLLRKLIPTVWNVGTGLYKHPRHLTSVGRRVGCGYGSSMHYWLRAWDLAQTISWAFRWSVVRRPWYCITSAENLYARRQSGPTSSSLSPRISFRVLECGVGSGRLGRLAHGELRTVWFVCCFVIEDAQMFTSYEGKKGR